ncbi:hypothetical protein LRP50_09575 [Enterovibrio sp. ZSDZ42]|uniref:Uncharacterized protein n=1 Tax=Enterovibrio gelatinilyticus TaxID=2899819 RepID=A0ABT5R0J9_9GAMM|nr:hypothetical protein [Enterovibrio sp. ZSDZ42]MDD1793375.1 hypothetical protein [Enterovibrio sp. ZSDZ42]
MNRLLGDYIRRNIDGMQTLKPVASSYYAGATRVTQEPGYSSGINRVNQFDADTLTIDAWHNVPSNAPSFENSSHSSDGVTYDEGDRTGSESSGKESKDAFSNKMGSTERNVSDSGADLLSSDHAQSVSPIDGRMGESSANTHSQQLNEQKRSAEIVNEANRERDNPRSASWQNADPNIERVHNEHVAASQHQAHSDSQLHEVTEDAANKAAKIGPKVGSRRQDFTQQVAASILGQSQNQSQTHTQTSTHTSSFASSLLRSKDNEPSSAPSSFRRQKARSEGSVSVNVTIDSVTIVSKQAPIQNPPQAERMVKSTWKPDLSLADYLRQRQEGER